MAGPTHFVRVLNLIGPTNWPSLLTDVELIKKLKHDNHPSGINFVVDKDSEAFSEYLIIKHEPLQPPPESPDKKRKEKQYKINGGFYAVLASGAVIDVTKPSQRVRFENDVQRLPDDADVEKTTFAQKRQEFNTIIADQDLVDSRVEVHIL